MDTIGIGEEEIKVAEVLSKMQDPSCGATAVFMGTTRDNFGGKQVLRLEYEAYESMALKEMNKISNAMKDKWPLKQVAIIHRTGVVPVGETSVLIAANSQHRKDALEAVAYGIDSVKATVPVWKKEIYSDGLCCWKENAECAWTKKCE